MSHSLDNDSPTRITVRIASDTRHELLKLMAECDFRIDMGPVLLDRAISRFMTEFINNCGEVRLAHNKDILPTLPDSRASTFSFTVNDATADLIPKFFHMEDWSQVVTNIAYRHLIPTEGYPKPISHVDPDVQNLRYVLWTAASQLDVTYYTPTLPHSMYIDNRPLDRDIGLIGPILQADFCWHLNGIKRGRKTIAVPYGETEKLLKIADHFHIVPIKSKTLENRLSIILEALHYKLLVPTTSNE